MTTKERPQLDAILADLLRRRYHGAANVRGVQFQLLYFACRAFDLYGEHAPDELRGEGLEDVDLRSVTLGNEYAQVKHYGRGLSWQDFMDIVRGFAPVLAADPAARFTIATSAKPTRDVAAVAAFVRGDRPLPPDVARSLARDREHFPAAVVDDLLGRLRFEVAPEERLQERLCAAVVAHFGVATGNEELYAAALIAELSNRAGNRTTLRRADLEAVRARVEEHVARGPVNPAVRDGFVRLLAFGDTGRVEDYYEGRAARPGHIAAGLDVRRHALSTHLGAVLSRVQVGVVLSSSGQGKSTLAFRYAFDHHHRESMYAVEVCQREAEVGQIAQFLRSRLRLGLPLLVVVDGLGRRTRLWHRLVAELAAEPVSFLVTAREEDWFRYAGQTSGFGWDVIRPRLDLREAERVFAELARRGRVAPGVPSARWAFERVRERGLLIEFIYLVTHGRLLAERLEEQLRAFRALREDPGKLEALRLVAVAQRYGARVQAADLARHAHFRDDPAEGLASLTGEYLACDGGYCEGLHPVRSEHLIALLHGPLPVEGTVERLVGVLDDDELDVFVGDAFADLALDIEGALAALARRCGRTGAGLLARMARACFEAEERRYSLRHRHLFDQAHELLGDAGVTLLATELAPGRAVNILERLAEGDATRAGATALQALASQFVPRVPERRVEHRLLVGALQDMDPRHLTGDLAALGAVVGWCQAAAVATPVLDAAVSASRWREALFDLPLDDAAAVALALSRGTPDEYRAWSLAERQRLVGFYKCGTRTFVVEEQGDAVLVRFPVDTTAEAPRPNDQAVTRLFALHRLLPHYAEYRSLGLYPFDEAAELPHDDTRKALPPENIWQEVDTSKNAAWIDICTGWYAADSVASWLEAWGELRAASLDFVRLVDRCHVTVCRGQKAPNLVNQLEARWLHDLKRRFQQAPAAPRTLARADRDRLAKLTRQWSSHFEFFARQLLESYPPAGSGEWKRLHANLMSAIVGIATLDEAFDHAAHLIGVERQDVQRPDREMEDYRRLADLLAFWFATRQRWHPQPHQGAAAWRRDQDATLVAEVRRVLRPLEGQGFRFALPTGPLVLDDPPLTGLCLGLELRDLADYTAEVINVAVALGGAQHGCDFLYLVPLLNGGQAQDKVLRIAADSARGAAAGRLLQQAWVLPVDPPAGLSAVLPIEEYRPLPEQLLMERFGQAVVRLALPLRLRQLATALLDPMAPFEALLLREIEVETATAVAEGKRAVADALACLQTFSPPTSARGEWHVIVEGHRTLANAVTEAPDRLMTLTEDIGLPRNIGHYLNAAYRRGRAVTDL